MYLDPIYNLESTKLVQLQGLDEIIEKDINDETYNKAVDDSLKAERTAKKRIIDAAKRLEQLGFPQDKISSKIRHDADKRGCTETYLNYISRILSEENALWIDKRFTHGGSTSESSENLENLTKKLGNHTFDDLRTNTADTIPEIAKFDLSDEQFNKLSAAEQ